MTRLGLHRDLSFCTIDDHLVFLDIQNDRYFRLSPPLESALTNYLEGRPPQDNSLRKLVEQHILINAPDDSEDVPRMEVTMPMSSAVEDAMMHAQRASVVEVAETTAIVVSTQLQLKARSLKSILGKLADYRERHTSDAPMRTETQITQAVAIFRRARLYVPIDTCCLLDSLSLAKFLARRNVRAELVFGVTADPFSAHCWVQHGTVILNDALGHALAHTPIRVI
ncbi:lasso peptide biosynthesis B2 protein [Oleiagrimonas sp. C23AA]|uniref:lasso peptide biosynthesis B2 protein n=1 Tax=Oleiagrimonas sp. C23AA TaxID=2719047 RepID=UPI00141EAA79|nr:lasso peptide biosynthesis B2 protein [Oleiagrimonas sp. C23AA]NII11300.1 lasso peptide biosynthesis B2 protein [Oleiagrimonas sp. C23AA]